MDVYVPETFKIGKDKIFQEDQKTIDPMIYNYISIVLKQMKDLQNVIHDTVRFEQGRNEFLSQAVSRKNCPVDPSNTIQLHSYQDELCKRPNNDYAARNFSSICEVNRIKPDSAHGEMQLHSNHVFKLGNRCYENKLQKRHGICVPFTPFMPAAATTFVQVLREGCLYDIMTEKEKITVIAKSRNNNIVLHKIQDIQDEFQDFNIKYRMIHIEEYEVLINSQNTDTLKPIEVEVDKVLKFRGPAILIEFVKLYKRGNKCEAMYTGIIKHNLDSNVSNIVENFTCDTIDNVLIPITNFELQKNTSLYTDIRQEETGDEKLETYDDESLSLETDDIETSSIDAADDIESIDDEDGVHYTYGNEEQKKFILVDSSKKITYSAFFAYKIAQEQPVPNTSNMSIRCGLNTYIHGRMGYKNVTYDGTIPVIAATGKNFPNKISSIKKFSTTRNTTQPTSSTLYFRQKNSNYEPPTLSVDVAEFGLAHEKDGLITLQKHLRKSKPNLNLTVVHNKLFLKHPELNFGGTPDGFVLQDHTIFYATVEVKCTTSDILPEIPPYTEMQCKSHMVLMDTILSKSEDLGGIDSGVKGYV